MGGPSRLLRQVWHGHWGSPYLAVLSIASALLLTGAKQAEIVRRRWWIASVWVVVAMAVPVLVLTPARPLWPACTILSRLQRQHPGSALIARALKVYSVYSTRADPLAAVRSLLPPDLAVVGFLARGDDPDISLWRPFGTTQVKHLLVSDSPATSDNGPSNTSWWASSILARAAPLCRLGAADWRAVSSDY